MNRHFLGINCQVRMEENEDVKIFTLACCEIKDSATANCIKKKIEEVLEEYKIPLSQVFSITTDNGTNFLKAVDMLNESQHKCDTQYSVELVEEPDSEVVDDPLLVDADDSDEWTVEEIEIESDDEVTENLEMEDYLFEVINKATIEFEPTCYGIRCAVHSFQLAIKADFYKSQPNINTILQRAREIVKKLRTLNLRKQLINKGCKKIFVLDVETRLLKFSNILLFTLIIIINK